jgi:TonB family protein
MRNRSNIILWIIVAINSIALIYVFWGLIQINRFMNNVLYSNFEGLAGGGIAQTIEEAPDQQSFVDNYPTYDTHSNMDERHQENPAIQKSQNEKKLLKPETKARPKEYIIRETEEIVAINSAKENPKEKPTETPKKKDTEVKTQPTINPRLTQVQMQIPYRKRPFTDEADRPGGTGNGGNGGGGTGTGQGSGDGSGIGPGGGGGTGGGGGGDNGPGFDLTGRNWRKKPSLEDNSQETGEVVIAIVVDKDGNVTSANGPARGSTIMSPQLYQKAKAAALQAKFTPSTDGVEEQRGTITFDFKLE